MTIATRIFMSMKMKCMPPTALSLGIILALLSQQTSAAIALDRTRVIYNGGEKAISVNISNQNKTLPYLAQSWIEDEQGNKLTGPLTVLPPVQRLDPGDKSQIKIQGLEGQLAALPQDRESVYYFNLREIPPKSNKPNVLQIALQTRVKLFYRPKGIIPDQKALANPWQEKITLTREGDKYRVTNPTPYYVTLSDATSTKGGKTVAGFEPVMVPPKGAVLMSGSAAAMGSTPVLTYINDYGGRPTLTFRCQGSACQVASQDELGNAP